MAELYTAGKAEVAMAGGELRSASEEPSVPAAIPGSAAVTTGSKKWHSPNSCRSRDKMRTGCDSKAEGRPGLLDFLFPGLWTTQMTHELHCSLAGPGSVHLFAALCSGDPSAKPVRKGWRPQKHAPWQHLQPSRFLLHRCRGRTPWAPPGRSDHHPCKAAAPAPHTHLPLWW